MSRKKISLVLPYYGCRQAEWRSIAALSEQIPWIDHEIQTKYEFLNHESFSFLGADDFKSVEGLNLAKVALMAIYRLNSLEFDGNSYKFELKVSKQNKVTLF